MTDTLLTADTNTDQAEAQTGDVENTDAVTPTPETQGDAEATEGTEPKEGEGGDEGQTDGDKDDDAPQGAPEAYEDFTVPEGVELDAEVTEEFKAAAKELNLTQAQAQSVTDLGVKLAQKWAQQSADGVAEMQAAWRSETEADKEIGGDALPANLSTAKVALDKFGTPALRELLDQSGLGNHPEVIRFMVRAGKTISEDTFVTGGNAEKPRDAARTLFPDMN